jgi:hypothetical protein
MRLRESGRRDDQIRLHRSLIVLSTEHYNQGLTAAFSATYLPSLH